MSVNPGSSGGVGVSLRASYGGEYSLRTCVRLATLAEQHGYDSVWLAESWGHDATSMLSTIAATTDRIRLGTAVLSVFARSPGMLAMTAATMSDLYPGRFVLGLGTGTKAITEGWHAMPFDRPLSRLHDSVEVVRQALTGNVVSYSGPTLTVDGFRLREIPEHPDVPVYVAGLGPRARRIAGQVGDGWLPYLVPLSALPGLAAEVRDHARNAPGGARDIEIAPVVATCVCDDPERAREQARAHLAFYFGAMGPHYREFVSRHGFPGVPDRIAAAWAQKDRDVARSLVSDEMLDELAVYGGPEEARKRLGQWRTGGADLVILQFPGTTRAADVEFALSVLATERPS